MLKIIEDVAIIIKEVDIIVEIIEDKGGIIDGVY